MAEQTIIHTKRDGILTISDDGDTNTYTVAYEAGDLSVTRPGSAEILILDRGVIGSIPSLRAGDEAPITFTFTAYLREVSNDTEAVLTDISEPWGGYVAANWVSTLAGSDKKTVTVRYTIDGSALGIADKTIRFDYCVLKASFSEGDPSSVSISGTSHQLDYVHE